MKKFLSVLLLTLVLITLAGPIPAQAAGSVLHVKPTASGDASCSSWANACTLQTALALAEATDEIWVQAGIYKPGSARTGSFALKNGVALYGGFVGTESNRDDRNWVTNETILSGDIDGDNSYHVVTSSGVDSTAILDGFTITAGQADGGSGDNVGGGMYNSGGSPTIRNVIFQGNATSTQGGGMYNDSGSPALTNVFFMENSAGWGAGLYNNNGSSPTVTNAVFFKNVAATGGGGVYNNASSSAIIFNATFYGNQVTGNHGLDGGGILLEDSTITVTNAILWGNIIHPDAEQLRAQIAYLDETSTSNVAYSIVQGGWPGDEYDNVDADPLFVDAEGGNLKLQDYSPAIDSGTNTGCPDYDIEGTERPQRGTSGGEVCDMGAYEIFGLLPSIWVGGVAISSDQPVVAVGRPHIGAEVASYIGATSGSSTQYVPMLFKGAFGGGYNAALYIQNISANFANLVMEFTNSSGAVVYTKNDTLNPNASKGYWMLAEADLPNGFAGGVKISSDQPILAVGRPHINGQVMTYNGISTGSTNSWLPMFFKNGFGNYNTALYIQNITSNATSLKIEYLNLDGTVACTDNDILGANASRGYWSLQVICDIGSLPMGFVGGVKVTSTEDILTVGRPHLGEQITTYNGFSGGSSSAYVPMLFRKAFGGSYNAALYLQNVSGGSAGITIQYVGNDGAIAATQNVNLAAGAIGSIWLPGVAGLPDGFVGGARITSTQDIVAVGRPHLGSEITAYNGTPAGSASAYLSMLFRNAYNVPYQAAFYIQNTSGNTASVGISFYDNEGVLSCVKSISLAPNATQGFWMPTVSCVP